MGSRSGVRATVFALLCVALIAACEGTPPSSTSAPAQSAAASAPQTSPAASQGVEPSASVAGTFPVDPFATPDEELVQRLMETEGLEQSEAIFVALTKVEARQVSPLTYEITQWYPTGNTGTITVNVTPGVTVDTDAAPPLAATYSETDGDFHARLQYSVAYDDMPPDVAQQIRALESSSGVPTGGALAAVRGFVAEAKSGARVLVEAVLKKMGQDQVKDFLKSLDQQMGLEKASTEKLYKVLKAALSVRDAMAMSEEHDAYMAKLDALEECVRNPTNEVTKETYRTNPAEQQRVLDAIDGARTEIKSNIAVIYLGMLNSVASGIVSKAAPWLGWLVGPGTAWSKETLRQMNDLLIDEATKMVVPCDEEWDLEMTMTYGSGADRLSVTWTGTFTVAPAVAGREERPITGAGHVAGEFHVSKCTIPTDGNGNSDVLDGDFRTSAVADFAFEGDATTEITARGPVLMGHPELKGIDESFDLEDPENGCLELAFLGGPLMALVMHDPVSAANELISVPVTDNSTVTEQVTVPYIFGEDRNDFPMTRVVTIKKHMP